MISWKSLQYIFQIDHHQILSKSVAKSSEPVKPAHLYLLKSLHPFHSCPSDSKFYLIRPSIENIKNGPSSCKNWMGQRCSRPVLFQDHASKQKTDSKNDI